MDLIKSVEAQYLKKDIPDFNIGDTIRVDVKVIEDDSERIQAFEGVVISRKGSGVGETMTVRKVSYGVGIERTFLIHSPMISAITLVRRGRVRRAKLYYLRERTGKAARIKEKRKKATTTIASSTNNEVTTEQKTE